MREGRVVWLAGTLLIEREKLTVGFTVLLVFTSGKVGGTTGCELVGEFGLVVVVVGDLVVGLSLIGV